MTSSDIREISDCVSKYVEMAKKIWPFQLRNWNKPTLSFDLRGTTAGMAYMGVRNHIQINSVLFKENKEDFFKRTIPHEVSHLVAFAVFGDRGHGKDWKFVMTRLGCDPSRCHSYDVSNVKIRKTVKRFLYSCPCKMEHRVTKQTHDKINLLGAHCLSCKGNLIFTGKIQLIKT